MLSRRLLRIKVVKALYAHFKSDADSLIASEKTLISSIEKCYDLYHQMLYLIVEVANFAEERVELGKQKKLPTEQDLNPNMRFIDNQVIALIAQSEDLSDHLSKRSLGWNSYPELIKSLYMQLVESNFYKEYMDAEETSLKLDLALVNNFFVKIVSDNEAVEDAVEEQSILWGDDVDFALVMVVRSLNMCKAGVEEFPILPKYKSDEDADFTKDLFRKSLVNYNEYIEYVDKFTQNWDVERIAFLDNVIMVAAIAEMVTFPTIPVKVTMDEFIEIAKYYSTPGSNMFINGVLDKVAEELTAEGRINKMGRGLI